MKMLVAKFVYWLCMDFCEGAHHFNITRGGYPGCIANWWWWGIGPNRWFEWALNTLEGKQQ